jgi:short-subunit dehydrogenase
LATARRADRLAAVAAEAAAAGATPVVHEAGDVTDPATRRRLVAAAESRLGGLDLVVAAAGSGAIGRFADGSPDTLRAILEIDLVAPAELVREALPTLARGRDPAVVLVGSVLGYHPLPLHAEYCAAKSGVVSLAGSLRQEFLPLGIDVVLATLGPTESEFWDALLAGRRPRWSRSRPLSAERTAQAIAVGLERRYREVIPGWAAKGFVFAARHAPWLIDAIVARRFRRDRAAAYDDGR